MFRGWMVAILPLLRSLRKAGTSFAEIRLIRD
jgi:hypothetical protein